MMGFHFQISKKKQIIIENSQFATKNKHINEKRGLYILKLALFKNNPRPLIIPAVEGLTKK